MSVDGAHEGLLASMAWQRAAGEVVLQPPVSLVALDRLVARAATSAVAAGCWPDGDTGSEAAYDRITWVVAGIVRSTFHSEPRAAMQDHGLLWRVVRDRYPWVAENPVVSPSVFQWCYGVNLARRLVELPPVPNPGLDLAMPVVGVAAELFCEGGFLA